MNTESPGQNLATFDAIMEALPWTVADIIRYPQIWAVIQEISARQALKHEELMRQIDADYEKFL